MDLIIPDFGLLFWTGIVFCLLLVVLAKFIWKPILSSVNEREKNITDALEMAVKTKAEMVALQAQNENILKEARAERDLIVKDARETAMKMVEDAKLNSKTEADKIIEAARQAIQAEKTAAMSDIRSQIASLSIDIAEKIVKSELASDNNQKALASKLAEDLNLN